MSLNCYLWASLVLSVVVVSSVFKGGIMGAVLALVATVVCVSLALFKVGQDYVAMVYLLVYVGAVLVLLMFVVLSVDTERVGRGGGEPQYALMLLLAVSFGAALPGGLVSGGAERSVVESYSAVWSEQQLGWEFFGSNGLNLLMVALLLFMAMVGAVLLAV